MAGNAAAPTARCTNVRRRNFIMFLPNRRQATPVLRGGGRGQCCAWWPGRSDTHGFLDRARLARSWFSGPRASRALMVFRTARVSRAHGFPDRARLARSSWHAQPARTPWPIGYGGSEASLHRIVFDVFYGPLKDDFVSNESVEIVLVPKGTAAVQQFVGTLRRK